MRLGQFVKLIKSDGYRYIGRTDFRSLFLLYCKTPGYNYSFKMRFAKFCKSNTCWKFMFPIAYIRYRRAMIRYGIVINSNVVIGSNVNISHGITIGQGGDDGNKGCPTLGDRVYVGPNSTIIGNVCIGSDSAIGANAFVNKNVDAGVTVAGIPAKQISSKGSSNYVHNLI